MNTPDCSIIIRAYNEARHIGRLLDGLAQQTLRNQQIVLVDSGSTDGTGRIARERGVEIVSIDPKEFSFGRSLNHGIRQARSEHVVICSAHVYPVYPDWLERLLEPLKDPKTALSYGKQRGNELNHFSEQQIFMHWYPDISISKQPHPFCNNANAAIQRRLWATHAYNENLPALEDLAWARWAHDQGYGIAYVAEAEIIHVHQESWRGIANRYQREGMAFKQIYPHENFRLDDLIRLFFKNAGSDWHTAREQKCLNREWLNIVRFRWMQFLGTYRGYHQSGPLSWQLKQAFYYPRNSLPKEEDTPNRNLKPIEYPEKHGHD
jgi:rhamnosyltransferase